MDNGIIMPTDQNEVKRIAVDVPAAEHKRYRLLSIRADVHMKDAALRGLELWERAGGKLPGYRVPVLGIIAAGPAVEVRPLQGVFIEAADDCSEHLTGDEYALLVTGDSMTTDDEGSIEDGDYALFRPGLDPCGRIAHVEWPNGNGDHECTLKRVVCHDDGTVTLKPANRDHKAIKKRLSEITVRGVFVGKGRKA